MSIGLREFAVLGLYGKRDLRIPFDRDRVVLAGINGLGKTTVMTLLYILLSRQFRRLLDFKFREVQLHFETGSVVITYEEIKAAYFAAALRRMPELFPAELTERFQKHPELFLPLLSPPYEPQELYRRMARTLERISQLGNG